MRTIAKMLATAALAAAPLAMYSGSASAAIVCNGDTCWHTHQAYDYPRDAHIVVHEDNWHWGPKEHYTFREHEGRGYWRGGAWTEW
jgi:hypothetical protein